MIINITQPIIRNSFFVALFAATNLSGPFCSFANTKTQDHHLKQTEHHHQVHTATKTNTDETKRGELQNAEKRDDLADLVEKLSPAVVNISTTGSVEISLSPFESFFGFNMMTPFGNLDSGGDRIIRKKTNALGSGFLVSEDGYVITNHHVVKDAEEIVVTTHDNQEYNGKIIGFDSRADIALIKIESKNKFPYAKFGNSDAARIGQAVVAIGNPFGFGGTVTSGIVSAKSRHLSGMPFVSLIQTDAAINMGNSGGPMFDMTGNVIGVNTAIYSPHGSSGNIGIGFAIPSNVVLKVMEALKKEEKVKYPWFGIMYKYVDKATASAVGMNQVKGIIVNSVSPDSPASKADIKAGDIILQIEKHPINKNVYIPDLIQNMPVGAKINVLLWRYGKEIKVQAVLMEQPAETPKPTQHSDNKKTPEKNLAGIDVSNLSDDLKQRLKIDPSVKGVMVVNINNIIVNDDDFLRKGDVVTQINETPIRDSNDFYAALQSPSVLSNKSAVFHIHRQGNLFLQGIKLYE